MRELDRLRGHSRVWVVFSHVHAENGVDEEAFFLHHLNSIGRRLDAFGAAGASVYLYDLSTSLPGAAAARSPRGPGTGPARQSASCCPGGMLSDACRGVSTPASPVAWMSS